MTFVERQIQIARREGQRDVLELCRHILRTAEYDYIKARFDEAITRVEEPPLVLEVPVSTARQANGGSSASAGRSTAATWPSTGEPEH